MFKIGSEGNEVRLIQSFLKSLGYNIQQVDGDYGNKTFLAVKQYQRDRKITVDGEVGDQTLSEMKSQGFLFSDERGAAVSPDLIKKFIERLKIRSEEFEGYVEIKSNASWDDPEQPGWQKELSDKLTRYMFKIEEWDYGAPYCAAAVGAFVCMALEDCGLLTDKFTSKWTAHVMTNVRMLKAKNILSITPSLGSIWLAKFGATDQGHTGVVNNINGDSIITLEGNTSSGPTTDQQQQRSGNGIFRRKFHKSGRGLLQTQGFLSAENILKFFVS
jgi:peptidoglycan hydrolase-like protein with peptidoglycan-binding domain